MHSLRFDRHALSSLLGSGLIVFACCALWLAAHWPIVPGGGLR